MTVTRRSAAAREEFERFAHLVLESGELHKALRETPEVESFIALAVELGRRHDCSFTAEDVRTALQEKRREWLQRWI